MIDEFKNILTEIIPQFAESLSETFLESWLRGAVEAGRKLPPPPKDKQEVGFREQQPKIEFPIREAALQDLTRRNIMTRPDFDALEAEAKQMAFTVARLASEDAISTVQQALQEDISRGGTLREFKETIGEALGRSALGEGHLENIYRTNIAKVYANGREQIAGHPAMRDQFPYRWEVNIQDSRLTELCETIGKSGLDGTGIYRVDDPVWQHFRGPRHWQCRCKTVLLSVKDAAKKGVKEAQEWLRTGTPPIRPEHVPWPNVSLPDGWTR